MDNQPAESLINNWWETNMARRRLECRELGQHVCDSWETNLARRRLECREFGLHVCELADYLKKGKYSLSEFEPDLRRQLAEVLDLLLHSSSWYCHNDKIRYMMALQGHVLKCKQARICKLCKSMTRFVEFHAGMCKLSHCGVRGCMEIRKHNLEKAHRREHRRKERELRKQMRLMTITEGGAKRKERELRKYMHLVTITEDGAIHMI